MQIKQGSPFRVKEVGDSGAIVGYGSVFGNVDAGYDVVEQGAFADSLEERGLPKMLWGHAWFDPPIGKWTKAEEDDHGLLLHGEINMKMQQGAEVHAALKMDTLDGLSIGYLEQESTTDKGGVRHLEKLDLFEVSVVTFPMNELARVDSVKDRIGHGVTKRELASILRDAGFSRLQAEALVARGYGGLTQSDSGDQDDDGDQAAAVIGNLFK